MCVLYTLEQLNGGEGSAAVHFIFVLFQVQTSVVSTLETVSADE